MPIRRPLTCCLVTLAAMLLTWLVLPLGAVGHAHAARGLSCSVQRQSLKLCSARTDNYKDCYNAADSVRELRTWLAWNRLRAGGATYRLDAGQAQFARKLRVHRVAGSRSMPRRAYVRQVVLAPGNVTRIDMRNGPPSTLWGTLLTLSHQVQDGAGVHIGLSLRRSSDGARVARTVVTYRHAPGIAGVDASSPEYNGPGGRWYVGSRRTSTDSELGAMHAC